MSKVFVDTNVFIYAILEDSPFRELARHEMSKLEEAGSELWISEQVIRESICVLTKKQITTPLPSCEVAVRDVKALAQYMNVCSNRVQEREYFFDLVQRYQLRGAKVYDAGIVASMKTSEIPLLLTNNAKDFETMLDRESILRLME